jgi:nucleoside-diphosphate-sugar epimerase
MRALIIGCGYLGRRVADLWTSAGHEVSALTRSPANAVMLREAGVQPLIGDVLDPASLAHLPQADTLLYAVGYDRAASASKREVYVNGLRNVLAAMAGRVGRVIYVSSTSVYGQSDGSWIDEESDCQPTTESGQTCLEAEDTLRTQIELGGLPADTTILRLAGLYGPGRLIGRLDQLRGRAPVAGRPDAWLNLIHVDDAARCVVSCAGGCSARSLYLVSDDEPVRRRDFYTELARRAGAPAPSFDADANSQRVSGLGKRCRNALLHRDLVSSLAFPDFRAGLASAM